VVLLQEANPQRGLEQISHLLVWAILFGQGLGDLDKLSGWQLFGGYWEIAMKANSRNGLLL
jgi:hypothetical protein